jgi:hypothetical protein
MINDVNILTTDDIKTITSISHNIDTEFLEPYIPIAETMWVYDVLGTSLTDEIKNQITGNTLTGNNYTLVEVYVKPLSAWATFFEASPFIAYKSTSKGISKQTSSTSENLSKEELEFYRQSIKDKVTFYRKRLQDYLYNNQSLYPNWRNGSPVQSQDFQSGIYLGNYN